MLSGRRSVAVSLAAFSVAFFVVGAAGLDSAATQAPGPTTRASVTDSGAEIPGNSSHQAMSGNGRFVAFVSRQQGVGVGPGTGCVGSSTCLEHYSAVYIRDLQTSRTFQVSYRVIAETQPILAAPFGDSDFPSVSDDGRYVSFVTEDETTANQGIPSGEAAVVVCDRGTPDSGGAFSPPDPARGTNGCTTVSTTTQSLYQHDDLVSFGAHAEDQWPRLSGDGSRIAWSQFVFTSPEACVTSETIFGVRVSADEFNSFVVSVPRTATGPVAAFQGVDTSQAAISNDGLSIVAAASTFNARACDGETPIESGILEFHADDSTDPSFTAERVDALNSTDFVGSDTRFAAHPTVSGDGKVVAFNSTATAANEAAGDDHPQVYAVATGGSAFSSVQASNDDSGGTGDGAFPVLSADARYLAFITDVPTMTKGEQADLFDFSCLGGSQTGLASRTYCQAVQRALQVSPASDQIDLVTGEPGRSQLATSTLACQQSPNAGPCSAADQGTETSLSLSLDGRYISFISEADDLVENDTNGSLDGGVTFGGDDAFVRTWHATASGDALDFGPVRIGHSAQQVMTVTVDGFAAWEVSSLSLTGDDRGDFDIFGSTCFFHLLIHLGESCVIEVQFAPTTLGPRTATISGNSDLQPEPVFTQTVTGSGTRTFVKTVAPGDNTRTSVTTTGGEAAAGGSQSQISGNGRWDVFVSDSDLAGHTPIDPERANSGNVFVRDLADPQHTVQISLHTDVKPGTPLDAANSTIPVRGHPTGASPDGRSFQPSISDDGRFVAFFTAATDIVPMPPVNSEGPPEYVLAVCDRDPTNKKDSAGNPVLDLPRRGTDVPYYVCFAVQSGGRFLDGIGADSSSTPRLSGDGSRIAWVEDDHNTLQRIRVAKVSSLGGPLHAPTTTRYVPSTVNGFRNVATASATLARAGNTADQMDPVLSDDGKQVVYQAVIAPDLYQDTVSAIIKTTGLIQASSVRLDRIPDGSGFFGDEPDDRVTQPAMSADGSTVAFTHESSGTFHVYVSQIAGSAVTSTFESIDNDGQPGQGFQPALSGDGRYLAFVTDSFNMHDGLDAPAQGFTCMDEGTATRTSCQVVAKDLVRGGGAELVSASLLADCAETVPADATCAGDGDSTGPSIDSIGSEIGFDSLADDLVTHDANAGEGSTRDAFVRTWRPELSASPVDFGTVVLGGHRARALVLTEHGFGPIAVGTVPISGPDAGDFTLSGSTCTGVQAILNDSQTCALTFRFAPPAPGARTGTVAVYTGQNGYPRRDPVLVDTLTGTGKLPPPPPPPPPPRPPPPPVLVGTLTSDPTTLEFGSRLPLAPGLTKTVTLTNTGTGSLTVTDVAVKDTTHPGAGGDYTVNATDCLGVLAPGASCAVTVSFVGHQVGHRDAQLVITDDSSPTPIEVGLVAKVAKPSVLANPGVTPPGRVTTIFGTGFAPGRLVDVTLEGFSESASVRADSHGTFQVALVIFRNTPEGPQKISAHTHNANPSIAAEGPLLVAVGSIDVLGLVNRH